MGLAVPDSVRTTLIVTACLLLVLGAISNSRAQQPSRDARYPAHWWTPIDDPKKPEWEILPQEAGPSEVILSKRNELGLLSNFAPTPFVFHGKKIRESRRLLADDEVSRRPRRQPGKVPRPRMESHPRSSRPDG